MIKPDTGRRLARLLAQGAKIDLDPCNNVVIIKQSWRLPPGADEERIRQAITANLGGGR